MKFFNCFLTKIIYRKILSKIIEKLKNLINLSKSFGTLYDYSQQIVSGDPSDYFYHALSFLYTAIFWIVKMKIIEIFSFNIELGSRSLESTETFPKQNLVLDILSNYLQFTLFSIVKSGQYFQ